MFTFQKLRKENSKLQTNTMFNILCSPLSKYLNMVALCGLEMGLIGI